MTRAGRSLRDKRPSGTFIPLPLVVIGSAQFAALPADAVKALLDLLAQYRLGNNGDLSSAWSLMKARGWRSKDRLHRALRDLEAAGFIVQTRQGGAHRPTLWGVTLFALDERGGRLDVTSADWERAHRGLWSRTPPIERGTARGFARGAASERSSERSKGTARSVVRGDLTSPVAGPIVATSDRLTGRSEAPPSNIAPVAGPTKANFAKHRPGSRSPLKNYHLPEAGSAPPRAFRHLDRGVRPRSSWRLRDFINAGARGPERETAGQAVHLWEPRRAGAPS